LEECCKEQGQLADTLREGLGSEWAVVPMMIQNQGMNFTAVLPFNSIFVVFPESKNVYIIYRLTIIIILLYVGVELGL
jgi:hypothetical protein